MTEFAEINTPAAAEVLRVVRNECAFAMTRHTAEITPAEQAVFYASKIATGKIQGFLLIEGIEAVAYGLLVFDGQGRPWSSTGVRTRHRGKGYGRDVTVEVARRAHAQLLPIWAEVRHDNAAQQAICAQTGYRLVESFTRGGVEVDVLRCDELAEAYR